MSITLNTDSLLPEITDKDIRLLIVGLAHSPLSVKTRHFYADADNQFYNLLFQSGLTSELLSSQQDSALLDYGIGLTTLVKNRPVESPEVIMPTDHSIGELIKMVFITQPELVCFNGEEVYVRFFDRHSGYGLQKETIGDAQVFAAPDSDPERNDMPFEEKLVHYQKLERLLSK